MKFNNLDMAISADAILLDIADLVRTILKFYIFAGYMDDISLIIHYAGLVEHPDKVTDSISESPADAEDRIIGPVGRSEQKALAYLGLVYCYIYQYFHFHRF